MTIREITQPPVEPVSLAEMKDFLRESGSDQDSVIQLLITAARQYAENYTRRAFVQRTFELTLEAFPYWSCEQDIELPKAPLISVAWVKFIDTAGVLQTVSASDYQVDTYRQPGRIKPAWTKYWQLVRNDFNAVQIRYDAGYAPSSSPTNYAENVPASVKQWIKVRVAQLYEHREAIVVGTIVSEVPKSFVDGILDPYIVRIFG